MYFLLLLLAGFEKRHPTVSGECHQEVLHGQQTEREGPLSTCLRLFPKVRLHYKIAVINI